MYRINHSAISKDPKLIKIVDHPETTQKHV